MKVISKIIILVALTTCILGCRKSKKVTNTQPIGPEYFWSRYMGTYDVYDIVNHSQWVMKLTHLYHSDYNRGNEDSVLIENFGNKFTIRDTWSPAFDARYNTSGFFLKGYNPIKDKNELKWSLNTRGTEPSDTKLENVLLNDTIIINFQLSNIAWYLSDGVPYYSCMDCKHIAVKRH